MNIRILLLACLWLMTLESLETGAAIPKPEKDQRDVSVEIPEVFELANIAIAISEEGLKHPYRVHKQGAYYQRVLAHFLPFKNHPLIAESDLHRNHTYFFRDNSACYVFNDGRIVHGGVYPPMRQPDLFTKHRAAVEDFARLSQFRVFYRDNLPYYQEQIRRYERKVPLGPMGQWLEQRFPFRSNRTQVIFSPLLGSSHETCGFETNGIKETIMFVSGPGEPGEHEGAVSDALLVRSVFTEIDHNYVNPITDQFRGRVQWAFGDFETWNHPDNRQSYPAPEHTFNEYMTWAVFLLYARDHYPEPTFNGVKSHVVDQMVNGRGFPLFGEFSDEFLRLYGARTPEGSITDLYPVILDWADTALAQHARSHAVASDSSWRPHLADYDAELRGDDGRVDTERMVVRLKELGVTSYYWLVWHASTDWEDLKRFLPAAQAAGIEVWVYLVPPSESPPQYGSQYSEPFRLDYPRWAEEIARLSLEHTNLAAWVIDDFYANRQFFTPAYLRDLRGRATSINPRLGFWPLMYFDELRPKFVEDYREAIDGVVVAYLQNRQEIERTWAVLNDADVLAPGEFTYPWDAPSRVGDFAIASQMVTVLPAGPYQWRFRERDDFTGPTAGYHFKQLLVDGAVVWEEDVAGGSNAWREVVVDLTEQVRGKSEISVGFRLFDKKAVSNFGVRWLLSDLRVKGLEMAADRREPQRWNVSRQGSFETGFGATAKAGQRRFHVPFISMTAANPPEFRLRHGNPATPERIAGQLRLSLQAYREGKCDGVVTYCLDKQPDSASFHLAQKLFHEFKTRGRR